MRVTEGPEVFRAWSEAYRRAGLAVGFVPTLGGLHDGHMSLVRQARRECDRVLVSIYLNPTQFDSAADLARYPSSPDGDLEACRREQVDLVYCGRRGDLLPETFQSWVTVEGLTRPLCGASRPGHFRGVATVVTQLLHLAKPHRAYFGLKDFQQARVVERMVRDLRFDVEIRVGPTVREADGLAMSSRNRRLSPQERKAAPALFGALDAVRRRTLDGETSVERLKGFLSRKLREEPLFRIDYAEILEGTTLAPFPADRIPLGPGRPEDGGALVAAAVHIGETRLIDNVWLRPEELALARCGSDDRDGV